MPSAMLPNIFDNDSSLFERRWIALGSLAIFVYLIQTIFRGRLNKLPPGPRGLPLFGNLFQMSIDAWVPFMEWNWPVVLLWGTGASVSDIENRENWVKGDVLGAVVLVVGHDGCVRYGWIR